MLERYIAAEDKLYDKLFARARRMMIRFTPC